MKNNCIFTICAKNYIGLARILENSIKEVNPGIDYYIFVADELSDISDMSIPDNVIECKSSFNDIIDVDLWDEMSFKYGLTEFCTSIKATCYKFLFNKGYEKIVFLDPDIYVFSSFNDVFAELDKFKIILTPHVTTFSVNYQGSRSEKGIMSTGVYNLGFLALRKSEEVYRMLNWWEARLKKQCYIDPLDSYFTDQKWMDFLPCFFDTCTLSISSHLGLNVAPWNFFEREIYNDGDKWYVRIRNNVTEQVLLSSFNQVKQSYPLVFVHFSGYDYQSLLIGNIVQNNIPNLGKYEDIDIISKIYSQKLNKESQLFNLFIKCQYTYDTFENGQQITHFHRRIFRSLIEEGEIILSPFSVGDKSFYSRLSAKGMLTKSIGNSVDKLNKLNLNNIGNKLRNINWMMRGVYKLIGIRNYTLIIRLMRPYSRIENQIHLINSIYDDKLK